MNKENMPLFISVRSLCLIKRASKSLRVSIRKLISHRSPIGRPPGEYEMPRYLADIRCHVLQFQFPIQPSAL